MKKLVVMLFVSAMLLSLYGCQQENIEETVEEHPYWEIMYDDTWKILEERYGDSPLPNGSDIVPDEKAAVAIARAVMENIDPFYRTVHEGLNGVQTIYVHKHNMWIVHFFHADGETLDGGTWIAIRRDTGEVLRIFMPGGYVLA